MPTGPIDGEVIGDLLDDDFDASGLRALGRFETEPVAP